MPNLLKIRLSLKGRPIRSYTFNKKEISIGRDPGCDIFLDNTGISREHAKIERTPGGYVVEDLGSANGTFLNEKTIQKNFVAHDDVVQIGKFSLWVGVEHDRRDQSLNPQSAGPIEGTTILSTEQMMDLTKKAKEPQGYDGKDRRNGLTLTRAGSIMALGSAYALGAISGVAVALLFLK